VPDLQGLIAPRPLLVEIGSYDECFKLDSAMSCFREVEKIYDAAGVREHLELDLFEGGHRWGGNKSFEFFRKWLGATAVADERGRERAAASRKITTTVWRNVPAVDQTEPSPAVGGGGSAGDADKPQAPREHADS